jgi:hypothetical protein
MAFKLGYRRLPGIANGGNIKNKDVDKDSKLYKEALAHEAVHCKEMSEGRIAYGDDWVRSDGKTYPRKDGKIKWTDGKWYDEGHEIFPWEQRAMKAENYV